MDSHDDGWMDANITPTPFMVIGHGASTLGWYKAFAELVDNAFDADADAVEIVCNLKSKYLSVSDNGSGTLHPLMLLRYGDRQGVGKVGRYGVGAKDAILWLCKSTGVTQIESVCQDVLRTARVDWGEIVKTGTWRASERSDSPGNRPRGTIIKCLNVNRGMNRGTISGIKEDLGYWFYPAIIGGKRIELTVDGARHLIPPYYPPAYEDSIDVEDEINGKSFRIHAGIVKDGQDNPRPGIAYIYKHRVICHNGKACGNFSTTRFTGAVHLDGKWKLSRNKDDIVSGVDELNKSILGWCSDLLSKAHEKSRTVELSDLEDAMSKSLTEALRSSQDEVRAKRKRKKNAAVEPATEPTGRGAKHERAKAVQPGDKKFLSKLGSSITVHFVKGLGSVAECELRGCDGAFVNLDKEHPNIVHARNLDDPTCLNLWAINALSIQLAHESDKKSVQRMFPFTRESTRDKFYEAMERLTRNLAVPETPSTRKLALA